MKKLLALLLVLVMALGCFAACGEQNAPETTAAKDPVVENDQTDPKPAEPLKVTFTPYNGLNGLLIKEDSMNEKYIEEKYNVDITLLHTDVHEAATMGLFWADEAENMDVIGMSSSAAAKVPELIDQGLLRTFPTSWLKEYAPDYWATLIEQFGEENVMFQIDHDGECWGVPVSYQAVPNTAVIRQDWLDNLGLDMPTDYESLEVVLKAFTEDDPDGNGKDDTFGIHTCKKGLGFPWVYENYALANNSHRVLEDGTVVNTSMMDGMKDAVKLIGKWYQAGWVDPESITDSRAIERDKWAQNKFGILVDDSSWLDPGRVDSPEEIATGSDPMSMLLRANPDAKLSYMPYWAGPDGVTRNTFKFLNLVGDAFFAFGEHCSDEIIQWYLTMRNDYHTDDEFWLYYSYGIEGVTFDYDENGAPKMKQEYATAEMNAQRGAGAAFLYDLDNEARQFQTEEQKEFWAMIRGVDEINWMDNFPKTGSNPAVGDYNADVNTVTNEWWWKFVTGEKDPDADWAAYIKACEDAGALEINKGWEEALAAG